MTLNSKITSVVAHIDHGKTTLIDSLISSQGHISKSLAGDLRYLDNRSDEQKRGITLKLSPIKLKNGHIFIDTPGHVDFESLICCSSILSDNYLILIDVNEGITPRTYSLVKYINKERSILVLNKVDKCRDFDYLQMIIYQLNGLCGCEIFDWSKNNIILCCASLCAGINYRMFKCSKKNTLKMAFRAFSVLEERYQKDDLKEIVEKYNIKYITKKNIFSTVMPLYAAIFDCVDYFYEGLNIEGDSDDGRKGKLSEGVEDDLEGSLEGFIKKTDFYTISHKKEPSLYGITVYGMLKKKQVYTTENILFVTKILKGSIKKGDKVYSITNDSFREVVVENIYDFSIDTFVELDCVSGPTLVCLEGSFLKNSIISNEQIQFHMNDFLTPFYKAKIVLNDLSQLENIKNTIRVLAHTEQCLKVKKNKFSELEVGCSGKVQFEKICNDLEECGFELVIKDTKKEFREFAVNTNNFYYEDGQIEFNIKIGNSGNLNEDDLLIINEEEKLTDSEFIKITDKNGNIFYIKSMENSHIIESVLEMFVNSGPLIKEAITNTFFYVNFIKESDAKIYNILKNELSLLYMKCNPSICPLFFMIRITIEREYLGAVYTILVKYLYLMAEEEFDEETNFFIVKCKIPQFSFKEFVEDMRIKSKGSAYLEVEDSGFAFGGDFSKFIDLLRSEKGLYVDHMIIENPDKQRTLKK